MGHILRRRSLGILCELIVVYCLLTFAPSSLHADDNGVNEPRASDITMEHLKLVSGTDAPKLRKVIALQEKRKALLDRGDCDGACDAQKDVLVTIEQMFGPASGFTVLFQVDLADLQKVTTLNQKAQQMYFDGRRKSTLAVQKNNIREYDESERLLLSALNDFKQTVGNESLPVVDALEYVGDVYVNKRDISKAIDVFKCAIAIQRTLFNGQHFRASRSYAHLGGAYAIGKDFIKAEQCFREALLLRRSVYGVNDIHVADLYGNLAYTLNMQQKYLDAEALCLHGIAISEELQQHDSRQMASLRVKLAEALAGLGEYEQAEYYLHHAIALMNALPPESRRGLEEALDFQSRVLRNLNRPDEAVDAEAKAARIRKTGK